MILLNKISNEYSRNTPFAIVPIHISNSEMMKLRNVIYEVNSICSTRRREIILQTFSDRVAGQIFIAENLRVLPFIVLGRVSELVLRVRRDMCIPDRNEARYTRIKGQM